MSTVIELFAQYEQQNKDIEALEVQLEGARKLRSQTVQLLKEEHGGGPHPFNGGRVIVGSKNGTFFLRPSPTGRKKKEAQVEPQETPEITPEVMQEST